MKRRTLFYYSEETVSYIRARGFRTRFSLVLLLSILIGMGGLFGINHYFGDVLGIDLNRLERLTTENRLLREQIESLNARLSDLSSTMNRLAERDNQLRAAVNLPQVDDDIRAVGTGGSVAISEVPLMSTSSANIMVSARQMLEKLEREVQFQEQSYRDVYQKSQTNKELFACIPAIKPMGGVFSYHGFGYRVHPILGIRRMHEGVDIINDVGTPVYATGNGVVEFTGGTGSNYGVAVEINHGFGYRSWYAHLLKPSVRPGQKVKRGQLIAYSGNSGLSSGPHLHYEVRLNGAKLNPVTYFVDDVDYRQIREQLAASSGW